MTRSTTIVLFALIAYSYCLGTIIIPKGPSANPRPVAASYVAKVQTRIDAMTARWQLYDAACSPKTPFMLMYLHMTIGVRDHIRDLYFDDGEKMANFTVVFADRYFKWLDASENGGSLPLVWSGTINYGNTGKSSVLEDLYLGMNAHINYDLGQIVYETRSQNYKDDFDRINDVLSEQMGPITSDIAARYDNSINSTVLELVSPVVLQLIMGWREVAWTNGILLIASPLTRPLIIQTMDTEAVAQSLPYKTYNAAGLGQPTAPGRAAYCNANRTPLGIA